MKRGIKYGLLLLALLLLIFHPTAWNNLIMTGGRKETVGRVSKKPLLNTAAVKPRPPAAVPAVNILQLAAHNKDGYNLGSLHRLPFYRRAVYRVPVRSKVVALSIDDGPDPRYTPAVLQILKANHIHATFFVVGREALAYPNLIHEELNDGNEIGNHTFSHPELLNLSPAAIKSEVSRGAAAIESITGRKPQLFRPPKGFFNQNTFDVVRQNHERVIMWTITVEHSAAPTPQLMAQRINRLTKPGYIILMHDGRLNRTRTVEALPIIIHDLKARGFRFVTVSQLMAMRGH